MSPGTAFHHHVSGNAFYAHGVWVEGYKPPVYLVMSQVIGV